MNPDKRGPNSDTAAAETVEQPAHTQQAPSPQERRDETYRGHYLANPTGYTYPGFPLEALPAGQFRELNLARALEGAIRRGDVPKVEDANVALAALDEAMNHGWGTPHMRWSGIFRASGNAVEFDAALHALRAELGDSANQVFEFVKAMLLENGETFGAHGLEVAERISNLLLAMNSPIRLDDDVPPTEEKPPVVSFND